MLVSAGEARALTFRYHFMFADHYAGEGATLKVDPEVYLEVADYGSSRPCNEEPVFKPDHPS